MAAAEAQHRCVQSIGGDPVHTARSLDVSKDRFRHSLPILSTAALGRALPANSPKSPPETCYPARSPQVQVS